jgi:hypothetical protein
MPLSQRTLSLSNNQKKERIVKNNAEKVLGIKSIFIINESILTPPPARPPTQHRVMFSYTVNNTIAANSARARARVCVS